MDREDTLRRLKNVEGHVRGIQRMVENDAYCIDLIRQIQAVQAALGKVSANILDDHLQWLKKRMNEVEGARIWSDKRGG